MFEVLCIVSSIIISTIIVWVIAEIKEVKMKPSFNIKIDGHDVPYTIMQFSGGELHVVLNFEPYEENSLGEVSRIIIDSLDYPAYYTTELALIIDALDSKYSLYGVQIDLGMTYIPYARQDRCSAEGNAFSLRAFAKQINAFNFNHVYVSDPHSDVATALINNCIVQTQLDIFLLNSRILDKVSHIVSPDAGAYKKTNLVVWHFKKEVITALKTRDTSTGRLSNTQILRSETYPTGLLVLDDIADGGATFIALGKELKNIFPNVPLSLYVTHGIFSKGTDELRKYYDNIYCHNLMTPVGAEKALGVELI